MCDFEDLNFTSEVLKVFSLLCRVNLRLNLGQTLPLRRFTCMCQNTQSSKCIRTKTHFIYLYIQKGRCLLRMQSFGWAPPLRYNHYVWPRCWVKSHSSMQNEMSQTEPRASSKLINCSLGNACVCSDHGWRTALCKMSSTSSPQNGYVNQSQQIWGVFHLTCQVASGSVL